MDITIALGGGGARGNAHIGVLRRLEREGFRVQAVAGTSFGGLVSALYASGLSPEEIERRFLKIDQSKLYGRSTGSQPSFLSPTGVAELIQEWFGDKTFSDLKIPCSLTAVDLRSATEVFIDQGRIGEAVHATIALPGIFPPITWHEHQLIDGGVLDPVPVTAARRLNPSLPVIAVVLTPRFEPTSDLTQLPIRVPLPTPIVERITRTRIAQAFNIFLQSVDIAGRKLTELRLQVDDPDVIVRPNVGEIGLLDKVDIRAVAQLGDEAVMEVMPQLKRAVSWPHRLRRKVFNK